MRTIEVSAKTRELAIKDALEQLGVGRDEVHVEILDEGSAGLFGFGARKVKLRVSTDVSAPEHAHGRAHHRERQPDRPRREQPPRDRAPREHTPRETPQQRHQQPQRSPRQAHVQRPIQQPGHEPAAEPRTALAPRKPATPARVYSGPPDTEAEALVREIVLRMGVEATISSATDESGAVSIKVESPDSAILIGRKGRSLESLQYLVNRMGPKTESEDGDRIIIDVEGYLGRRQEALEELAHRLADRARESGRRQRTKPMTSQERRAVHLALEGDETIKTYSMGDGSDRYVIIAPADEKAGSDVERGPRGRGSFRGDRAGRGGERRGDRRDHGPRGQNGSGHVRPSREPHEDNNEVRATESDGGDRRRRRSRRGGRGRGPRAESPAPQNDAVESGPQDS